jgi:hypothetical protein
MGKCRDASRLVLKRDLPENPLFSLMFFHGFPILRPHRCSIAMFDYQRVVVLKFGKHDCIVASRCGNNQILSTIG